MSKPLRFIPILLLSGGCASAPAPLEAQAPPAEGARESVMVPPGFGTLRQDEVTIQLRSDALLIKVTPLDEALIRLLAPDTYQRLHALATSRRPEAARETGAEAPVLFLVSFFSYQPDVSFQPEDLQLQHRGRILRADAILPVTAGFGRQRLAQQENQSAIYAFDAEIDHAQPITVRYGFQQTDQWTSILPVLEVERAKVRARAGG